MGEVPETPAGFITNLFRQQAPLNTATKIHPINFYRYRLAQLTTFQYIHSIAFISLHIT